MSTTPSIHYYTVTVPEFVRPGELFPASVGGELIQIRCPTNAHAHSILHVKVVSPPTIHHPQYSRYVTPPADTISSFNRIWIFLDLILVLLFIVSISLTRFAVQRVNSNCNVLNPNSGEPLSQLYYRLYSGLGDSETCSDTGSNFW